MTIEAWQAKRIVEAFPGVAICPCGSTLSLCVATDGWDVLCHGCNSRMVVKNDEVFSLPDESRDALQDFFMERIKKELGPQAMAQVLMKEFGNCRECKARIEQAELDRQTGRCELCQYKWDEMLSDAREYAPRDPDEENPE